MISKLLPNNFLKFTQSLAYLTNNFYKLFDFFLIYLVWSPSFCPAFTFYVTTESYPCGFLPADIKLKLI